MHQQREVDVRGCPRIFLDGVEPKALKKLSYREHDNGTGYGRDRCQEDLL
jgi:hypothetical protein